MRLTARRRAVLAVLGSWPIGYVYISWSFASVTNLAHYYRGDPTRCSSPWQYAATPCILTGYRAVWLWVELIVITLIVIALAALLARWVMYPVRQATNALGQFGPASLGLRLPEDGPHDEMHQLASTVNVMLAGMAEGYEAQRRFAANASHELRTPLATQRALIEVSMSSALSPDGVELLSRQLLATNERNERLIEGLLTLTETDRGLVSATHVRLDAIAADTVAQYRQAIDGRQLHLTVELAPVTVIGEPPLLERLVANLVENAVKYNEPNGSISVTVHEGTLRVTNTGPVVPAELVPRLIEPFRRMSGDRLDHGTGVGLGLTIVRSIVQAHGGQLTITAQPQGGLAVEVRLRTPPR